MRASGLEATSLLSDATSFLGLLPALVGGVLFAAIYTDDLDSGSLATMVGFGLSRTRIVIAKTVVMALCCLVMFAMVPLMMGGVHAALGWIPDTATMTTIMMLSLQYLLLTIACAALASIAVYGIQNTTIAVVVYLLLAFNIIGGLIATVIGSDLIREHLIASNVTARIYTTMMRGVSPLIPLIEYLAFVVVALTVAIGVFRRKELEF
jgi:ABC-type transport system involved in multi-copper enzyme maturation permease subunit